MAHLLNVEAVTVAFAARTVLDAVSLGLDDGDRIGVVGRNGDGKSTLLRVLARQQAPDGGRVTHAGGLDVGMLGQTDDLDPELDVRHSVVGDVPDHVWATQAAVRDVLVGLLGGLDAPTVGGLDAVVGRLSGGQRRRVALAALLTRSHDVVLLDEPTNHLDVEGVDWLARHLRERWPKGRGGLAVVTHDRWFLDAVCDRTWEVHDGVVDAFEGGYAAYVLARAERVRVAAATEERRRNLLRKELAWLRRGPPARTSKPRFRIDAANALIADEPPPRDGLALERMATARLGKDVVDLEDVRFDVGSGDRRQVLLDEVTWRIGPGERIGIVGVNGSGKTTLLRLVLGEVAPAAGRVRRGKTVRSAMLSQDVRELDDVADLRVQEAVEKVRGAVRIGDRDVTAGQLLERLGFTRERVWTPVGELSGGERRRVQLLRLLMGEPNLLALDEPTNDLDTDTLAAVEDTLDGWPGTLLVVSHDRYLLERVTDRQVALLGDGRVRDLPGGVEEYLHRRRAIIDATVAGTTGGVSASGRGAAKASEAGSRSGPAPGSASAPVSGGEPSAGDLRAARKDMTRIERQISRLAGVEEKLHAEMAEKATDHKAVLALDARLRALVAEREALEEAWLEAAETTAG
ncbi:MAG: ABC-F family ATP-binding cassette domain-containing protein [Kineosporiaceae bacterium]